MKWSTWSSLAAPFALLLLVLGTVVMLPRVQAARNIGMRSHHAPVPALPVVNLPAVIVTPKPSQAAAQTTSFGSPYWASVTSTGNSAPLARTWLDLGMPYYSFGNSVLISAKD